MKFLVGPVFGDCPLTVSAFPNYISKFPIQTAGIRGSKQLSHGGLGLVYRQTSAGTETAPGVKGKVHHRTGREGPSGQ